MNKTEATELIENFKNMDGEFYFQRDTRLIHTRFIEELLAAQDLLSYERGREEGKKEDIQILKQYPDLYVAQERAMAPGIGGELPEIVKINKNCRLKKIPKNEIEQKFLNSNSHE